MTTLFQRVAGEVCDQAERTDAPKSAALHRLDRRARVVLGLFSRMESVTAAEMARAPGLAPRTVRDLIGGWLTGGWRTRRASRGAIIYRRNIGSLSAR